MKLRLGIFPKLILILVFFAAILLTAIGVFTYNSARVSLQSATISELIATAIEKQSALNTWVEERQYGVTALTKSPDLIREMTALMSAKSGSLEAQTAHNNLLNDLATRSGSSGQYLELIIIEPDTGMVVVSTKPGQEGKFKENLPYFISGKLGPFVQNVYFSPDLQAPAMTASAPIQSANGQVIGVLAGRLNLAEMNAIITRRTGLHQTDDAFLVNTSNLFVTQPRLVNDPAVLQRGVYTEAVNHCLAHNSGVVTANDYRGDLSLIVYRWLPERQLCLIVKIGQAEALAPSHSLAGTILLIGGIALLLATGLSFWLARTITRPVSQLVSGVEEIGQGHLNYRIPVHSVDELGRLAGGFNEMAAALTEKDAQLQDHANILERIVQERTANLKQANESLQIEINEHNQAEEKIRMMNEELEERVLERTAELEVANKELEAFSYSVSHDLRSPLRAIDGFSRILMEEFAPSLVPGVQQYLELVRKNAQQMGHLVDDLLSFSRIGRQALNLQKVYPAELITQVMTELKPEQEGHKIKIIIGDPGKDLKEALPACLADPALLKQVFINLLSNALKFTHKRKVSQIKIGASKKDAEWVYFVKDNGVGFDMQYMDKLFGVFQRLHSSKDYEGTGVGLAIVQRIINRHGGRVWAESEVDKGATFYFTLGKGDSDVV